MMASDIGITQKPPQLRSFLCTEVFQCRQNGRRLKIFFAYLLRTSEAMLFSLCPVACPVAPMDVPWQHGLVRTVGGTGESITLMLRWRHCVAASGILVGLLDIVNSYLYRWSPRDVRQKIRYKHRLWNRYIETMDLQYLTKYKKRLEIIFVE